MITAATSGTTEVAEELLSYFVDIGNKECFAALLFICFDLLRSDVVEELSWQHGLNDFYMPYKIQVQRSLVEKVSQSFNSLELVALILWCRQLTQLEKEVKERSKKDAQKEQTEAEAPIINPGGFGGLLLTNGYVPLFKTMNGLLISIFPGLLVKPLQWCLYDFSFVSWSQDVPDWFFQGDDWIRLLIHLSRTCIVVCNSFTLSNWIVFYFSLVHISSYLDFLQGYWKIVIGRA